MITFLKSLTLTGRLVAGGLVLVLAIALFLTVRGWFVGSANVEADLANEQGDAALQSGQDAVENVGAQGAREDQIDNTTRENDREIRNAEGADAPVNPDLRDAGLRSLCKRPAYSSDPKCLQFAPTD